MHSRNDHGKVFKVQYCIAAQSPLNQQMMRSLLSPLYIQIQKQILGMIFHNLSHFRRTLLACMIFLPQNYMRLGHQKGSVRERLSSASGITVVHQQDALQHSAGALALTLTQLRSSQSALTTSDSQTLLRQGWQPVSFPQCVSITESPLQAPKQAGPVSSHGFPPVALQHHWAFQPRSLFPPISTIMYALCLY